MGGHPPRLTSIENDVLDGNAQFPLRGPRRVGSEDAGVGLDDVGERPEGHAVAVRKGASLAPEDHLDALLDLLEELPDESGFADSRRAHEGYKPRLFVCNYAPERADEDPDLARTAHQSTRVTKAVGSGVPPRRDHFPHRDGVPLALRVQGRSRLKVDLEAGGAVGFFVDEDSVDGRACFEARGGIDDVAVRHCLTLDGTRAYCDRGFSGCDADANVEHRRLVRP